MHFRCGLYYFVVICDAEPQSQSTSIYNRGIILLDMLKVNYYVHAGLLNVYVLKMYFKNKNKIWLILLIKLFQYCDIIFGQYHPTQGAK